MQGNDTLLEILLQYEEVQKSEKGHNNETREYFTKRIQYLLKSGISEKIVDPSVININDLWKIIDELS